MNNYGYITWTKKQAIFLFAFFEEFYLFFFLLIFAVILIACVQEREREREREREIYLMWVNLTLQVHARMKFLSDWCPKVPPPSHIWVTGLNLEFTPFFFFLKTSCHAKVPSLPYYLTIDLRREWRIVECTSFPRLLALCEIQTVPSRIWTLAVMSISPKR